MWKVLVWKNFLRLCYNLMHKKDYYLMVIQNSYYSLKVSHFFMSFLTYFVKMYPYLDQICSIFTLIWIRYQTLNAIEALKILSYQKFPLVKKYMWYWFLVIIPLIQTGPDKYRFSFISVSLINVIIILIPYCVKFRF